MDKIFAKTLKTLTLETFKLSKPSPSELIFKNWDLSLFLIWYETSWEKIEETDDPEILHCRQMGKGAKPNWSGTHAKVSVQLIFSSHRRYRLSVAGWWYALVRLWVKLFVSKGGLIQAFFGLLDRRRMICCNIPCFYWKRSTWTKENKGDNPSPNKCSLIIVLRSLGRRFLVWLCKKTSI